MGFTSRKRRYLYLIYLLVLTSRRLQVTFELVNEVVGEVLVDGVGAVDALPLGVLRVRGVCREHWVGLLVVGPAATAGAEEGAVEATALCRVLAAGI